MEPEVSLPCWLEPSTGPFTKQDQSNLFHPIKSLWDPFSSFPPTYVLVFVVIFFTYFKCGTKFWKTVDRDVITFYSGNCNKHVDWYLFPCVHRLKLPCLIWYKRSETYDTWVTNFTLSMAYTFKAWPNKSLSEVTREFQIILKIITYFIHNSISQS